MKRRRGRLPVRSEINVTPFIDILLVLLVIFMTITPTTPTGLKTAVPQPPPLDYQHNDEKKIVVLNMDRNGTMTINQVEVEPVHLIDTLREIFKTRSERTMFVQADHELLFNDVAQAIDSAKAAGVNQIGLITDQILGRK